MNDRAALLKKVCRLEDFTVGWNVAEGVIAVMWWLAQAKAQAAREFNSRALQADTFQPLACWWLSIVMLVGLGLNAAFGWWWAFWERMPRSRFFFASLKC